MITIEASSGEAIQIASLNIRFGQAGNSRMSYAHCSREMLVSAFSRRKI